MVMVDGVDCLFSGLVFPRDLGLLFLCNDAF